MTCKHKFVFKSNVAYFKNNGRYCRKYVSIDYFFCEKCLEEKEVKKEAYINDNDVVPDWAKLIIKQVADYE